MSFVSRAGESGRLQFGFAARRGWLSDSVRSRTGLLSLEPLALMG